MEKIKRNRAQCLKCKDIIESKSQNDFVRCSCGEIFVDGGLIYSRRGCTNWKNFKEMVEFEDENKPR